jgi:uncharacterized protein (TIGR03083 family)
MDHAEPTAPEMIDIWQEALTAVADLADHLDDTQWLAPTPCPGWSAADVVAHVIDIEQLLAGSPRPENHPDWREPDWAALPHAQSDFGRFTEIGVDHRRGRPRPEVVAELRETIAVRRAQLDAVPAGAEVIGPMGNPTTLDRLLRMRILDSWMHEQDIRTAAGIDGGWDTRPAWISYQQVRAALPVVWSKKAGAPGGDIVRIDVTGPGVVATMAAVTGEDDRGALVDPPVEATVLLRVSWPDLVSLAAGRIDPTDPEVAARLTLDGDPGLGAALLPALAITP